MEKISIVIPANNEEENLGILLEKLLAFEKQNGLLFDVLIVNDGSLDKTGEVAESFAVREERLSVIHNRGTAQGMGSALKRGTRMTRTPVVVWLMGDLSDDLNTIPRMCEKMEEGYDVVVASRYMQGGSSGDLSAIKSFLSRSYSFFMRKVFHIPVHDINNAFRGFRREVFENVHLECDDFAISPEFIIKANRVKYRIGEVPTIYANRKMGKNKFRILRMMFRYSLLLRFRFQTPRPMGQKFIDSEPLE